MCQRFAKLYSRVVARTCTWHTFIPTTLQAYFKKVLATHPDKGGDAAEFRALQAAFEVLRSMVDKGKVTSFTASRKQSTQKAYNKSFEGFEDMPTPSWDFYAAAADEPIPAYRIERARSGRSSCQARGIAKACSSEVIEDGEVRIGWINPQSGGYGRWVHLRCWRVPSTIWLGLPNPDADHDHGRCAAALRGMNEVMLSGFSELPPVDQQAVIDHVMDKSNRAKLTKRPRKPPGHEQLTEIAQHGPQAIVPQGYQRQQFIIPQPGQVAAPPDAFRGKTVTLTGVFPEVGGGIGLNMGKDRVKGLVESFGGRVTSSISGKTDLLIVGKDPGASKVSKARHSGGRTRLTTLHDVKVALESGNLDALGKQPLQIENFSSGFYGNTIANRMTDQELMIAAGTAEAPRRVGPAAPRKAPAAKRGPAAKKGRPAGKAGGAPQGDTATEDGAGDEAPPAKKTKRAASKQAAPQTHTDVPAKAAPKKAAAKAPKAATKRAVADDAGAMAEAKPTGKRGTRKPHV